MTAKVDGPLDLTITRTFDAPARVVFGIWADREHMIKWWGPKNFDTTHLDVDFRVGGAYRACIVNQATRGESWMSGHFVEIVENQRIVFTFKWDANNVVNDAVGVETLVTITLDERNGQTTQTFHQAPFLNVESRDSHIGGWTQFIDKEQNYAERVAKGDVKS